MKVLHISPSYKPAFIYGGPTVSVSQLCESQAAIGHDVSVYTTTACGKDELNVVADQEVDVNGVAVTYFTRVTKDHSHFSPSMALKLWATANKYEIIHIHSWWNLVALVSTFACVLKGITPILSPRGMLGGYTFQRNKSALKFFIHSIFGRFLLSKTVLHATSRIEDKIGKAILPRWKTIILPNIIDLPDLEEIERVDNKLFHILFLSRIDAKKNLEVVFHALERFQMPFELTIAGSGTAQYMEDLKTLAGRLQISEKINWVGWIESSEKYKLLRQSDLLILTSFTENFANVVVESLYTGTPVLVSDQVGLWEYVQENDYGWVTSLEVETVRQNLIAAYHDVNKRRRIRKDAPKGIAADFNGRKVAHDYISFYKEVNFK